MVETCLRTLSDLQTYHAMPFSKHSNLTDPNTITNKNTNKNTNNYRTTIPTIPATTNTSFHPPTQPVFPVGVELYHDDLGDTTSHSRHLSSNTDTPVFVRNIMHRPISARGFIAHVQYDAPASAIAAAVGVPEHDVENLWLAGVRTITPLRSTDRRLRTASQQQDPKQTCMRFTPQSVLDCPIISDHHQPNPETDEDDVYTHAGLDRSQFADLFMEDDAIDQECLQFGNQLMARLEALAGTSRAFPRYQPPTRYHESSNRVQPEPQRQHHHAKSQLNNHGKREATAHVEQDEAEERACGFSQKHSHPDVSVLCDGLAISKTGSGLYRTARSVSAMRPPTAPNARKTFYFEVAIVEDADAGGICVGVATDMLKTNKLVGSDHMSCGLHSSGQVVSCGGEFGALGKRFKKGDRIGCLVTLFSSMQTRLPTTPPPSASRSFSGLLEGLVAAMGEEDEEVELSFFINGELQGKVRRALWQDLSEDKRQLYAAVSLYKKDSKAVIQCCRKYWCCHPENGDTAVEAICGDDD